MTPHRPTARLLRSLLTLALCSPLGLAWSADPSHAAPAAKTEKAAGPVGNTPKEIGDQVREAVSTGDPQKKRLTLIVTGKDGLPDKAMAEKPSKPGEPAADEKAAAPSAPAVVANPVDKAKATHLYIRARKPAPAPAVPAAAAHAPQSSHAAHDVHWSYQGEGGPANWGKLKPEFSTCANGQRQSPVHIEDAITLQGPAEPIQFNYQPSTGTVINNGHTVQVDVYGENSITVRGSTYKLLQFHFHHPSEERVNYKSYAMVAHLVHRNVEGQLAVVGVLIDPGEANALINRVWTYMPLDAKDAVRMPDGSVNLNELLPKDQRYYQFLGSLTTPPCSEGVLWMVLKQPVSLSKEQIKLFGQLFPNNARPVQPVNGRPIRNAQ